MFAGIAVLLACQAVGEWLAAVLHIAVPGPVLGMALLATVLASAGRMPAGLAQVADALLKAMPLFFIPAGVGVLVLSETLRSAWLPITVALLVSTLLAIMATALVMKAALGLLSRARSGKGAG
jgi:holin-like protein